MANLGCPPTDEWPALLEERSARIDKKLNRSLRKSKAVQDWMKASFEFDRFKVAKFVTDAQIAMGLGDKELAVYLTYADGSAIRQARRRGSISSERFHRLLTKCFGEYQRCDVDEARVCGTMRMLAELATLERDIHQRRMNRTVYQWLDALHVDAKYLECLIEDRRTDEAEERLTLVSRSISEQLKTSVINSVTMRRSGKLEFHEKNSRAKKGVKSDWDDVRKLLWEWHPCFNSFSKVIVDCV